MATLDDLWPARGNLCYVAYRAGTTRYVALAHKTPDLAFAAAAGKQGFTLADRVASDWQVGELVADDGGRVIAIRDHSKEAAGWPIHGS